MKELFKNVINNGDFELKDILNKISESYIKNDLSNNDKEELESLARDKANPQNSYAPLEQRLEEVFKRLQALEEVVFVQEEEPNEEETVEEFPEYVQPTGSHNAYKAGDKVTFENKKYTCLMDNCVWNPNEYPQAWEIVE